MYQARIIMVNNGQVLRGRAGYTLWGVPESVLWIKKDGSKGVSRVKYVTDIPGYKDIHFAIGGVGISNYSPESEGFSTFTATNQNTNQPETKKFGDVLRETNHSVFGFKDDLFFASIMYGTAKEIKAECEKYGLTHVIMGDGGSYASCNTKDFQLNLTKHQYSAVQIAEVVDYKLEPVNKPVEIVDKGDVFTLSDLKDKHTPILPGLHFYWDEYLQNNLKLKGYEKYDFNTVESPHIMYEIVFHALMMEEFRSQLKRGISATSGHRPDIYNDVILIQKGYKSTKTSDHKFNNSAALDTNVPVSTTNISRWKAICKKYGVSYSIGLYKWGMHLGYRRNQKPRMWDWR